MLCTYKFAWLTNIILYSDVYYLYNQEFGHRPGPGFWSTHDFPEPVVSREVYIILTTWVGDIAMRVQLYGCPANTTDQSGV